MPAFIIEKPVVYTLTDTALTKDGKPFFIPDFASPCTFQMSLVLRISRLGRSISPRFAHRYYDALTAGVMFTAQNLFEYCVSHSLPWEMAKGFDGAAALGRFVTLTEESKALSGYDFHLERGGNHTKIRYDTTSLLSGRTYRRYQSFLHLATRRPAILWFSVLSRKSDSQHPSDRFPRQYAGFIL